MAYRLTNSEKWTKDSWYMELDAHAKLMFDYLCDNCDIAGFYELSLRRLKNDLHPLTDDQIKVALQAVESRYVLSRDKHVLFLKNFCKHQKNLPLNPNNKAHVGIINKVNIYKDRFAHDLMKIIENSCKTGQIKGASKPLERGTGIGNIEFNNFWCLYDKKIGNKHACEKKWNKLKSNIQKKIIEILPEWKNQFDDKQFQPYPETFLNQQRWNDEIPEKNAKTKPENQTQNAPASKVDAATQRHNSFVEKLRNAANG